MILDGHFVSNADMSNQTKTRPVGVLATGTGEWPLPFVRHVFFPDSLAEVGDGQMAVEVTIVPKRESKDYCNMNS